MHLTPLVMAMIEVGQYISLWKVLPFVIILLIWARLLTWMDKDAIDAQLPRQLLNTVEIFLLIAGVFGFLLLPTFLVALSVMLFFCVAGIALYLILRQQKVGLGDLNKTFTEWLTGLFSRGPKEIKVEEGEVQLLNKAGNPQQAPDAEDPELPGYLAVQRLLTDP